MSVTLAVVVGALYAIGTYLILQRTLTRVIIGLGLMGHGAVLVLLLAGGAPGRPAFVGSKGDEPFSDPLPQALALTAIVIAFGVTAFLLALAYRSWVLTGDDEVRDDVEDRQIVEQLRKPEVPDAAVVPDVDEEGVPR